MKKAAPSIPLWNSGPSAIVLASEVRVRVTPRGGRDAVVGIRAEDGVLLLRASAPPVHGAANRACIGLVAEALGVKKAQVSLAGGETFRENVSASPI